MKLEKFSKNKKQKKIIIGTIVGLILLVGGITLYRAFALYEEKKEFNVLKGRVPDFKNALGKGDIQLSFTINGASSLEAYFPNKEDGYGVKDVDCKNEVTAEWNNASWGLINIKNVNSKKIECTINFVDANVIAEKASVGDYLEYTPSKTSYKIGTDLTGYSAEQIINPSDLNLWRIIKINDDGTIEAVSEYASNELIYFYGRTGYEKIVGSLNTIAKQYETEGITVSSRHMGYSGQTGTISASGNMVGNDTGYTVDYNLVNNAIGNLTACKPNTIEKTSYWLTSRYAPNGSVCSWIFYVRAIDTSGGISFLRMHYHDCEYSQTEQPSLSSAAIRPIITIRAGQLGISGLSQSNKTVWSLVN